MLLQRRMLQSRIKVGIYFKVTDLIINCCFCSPLPQVSSTKMWIYLRLKGAVIFFWCRGRHLRSLNTIFKLHWQHSTYLPIVAPEPPPKKLLPVAGAQSCLGLRCLNLHTQDKVFIPYYILLISSLNRTPGHSPPCLVDQKKIKLLVFGSICTFAA